MSLLSDHRCQLCRCGLSNRLQCDFGPTRTHRARCHHQLPQSHAEIQNAPRDMDERDQVLRRNYYITAMRLKNAPCNAVVTNVSRPVAQPCPSSSNYQPHICDRPFTITTGIAQQDTPRVLLKGKSPVNIFFFPTVSHLSLEARALAPYHRDLHAFDGARVLTLGSIDLHISIGMFPTQSGALAHFVVVDHSSPYFAIFGRPLLRTFRITLHYRSLTLRLPTSQGVVTIFGNRTESSTNGVYAVSTECQLTAPMDDPQDEYPRPQPLEDLESVVISERYSEWS